MTKVKINPGLASVMLVASIFAGWECLLLVTLLMFVFCEIDEKIQNVAIRVITFMAAYTIISWGWTIITSGIGVITGGITDVVAIINTYLDPVDQIETTKLLVPVTHIVNIADSVVDFLLLVSKLGFVISIFTFKAAKSNPILNKINEYVNKVLNYINGNVAVQQQPVQPQQPTQVQQ